MATLTVQQMARSAGLTVSFAAAAGGGDEMPNPDGNTLLLVKNGGGGSINVTLTPAVATREVLGDGYGPYTRPAIVVAVNAGAEAIIGPMPPNAFNNASGRVPITYSGVTSVTVAALKMPT